MRRSWFLAPIVVAAVALGTACTARASGTAPAASGHPRLVFFMNPNGMPCQMQDRILQGMASELAGKVDVVRYKTTEPADLDQFRRFGIRALPTLVVTDRNGKELRRAPPGIQSPDEVRALVGG